MAEVIELENLPTSWTLLRSSSYWKTDYGCKPLWGPPGLEKTQPGLGSDGGVESHTSFSGQLPSVPDRGPGRGRIGWGSSGFCEAWMEVWKERRLGRDQEATNNPDVGG